MGRHRQAPGDAVAVTQRRARPERPEKARPIRRAPGASPPAGAGAIRIEELPLDRIAAVLRLYEELVAITAATNNTLLARLLAVEETTDAHVGVLNEWSAVNNQIQAAHALELERLTATLN